MNPSIILPPTLSHLHPLQGENCDSNSRLVEDEDDHGKFRLEKIKRRTVQRGCNKSRQIMHSDHSNGRLVMLRL